MTMIARAAVAVGLRPRVRGRHVSDVDVHGRDAGFELTGAHGCVITPSKPIRDRRSFVTQVDFTAGPDEPVDEFPFGWFTTADGSVTAGQPDQGHTIYPVNDHPVDKATYTFLLDVRRAWRPCRTANCGEPLAGSDQVGAT